MTETVVFLGKFDNDYFLNLEEQIINMNNSHSALKLDYNSKSTPDVKKYTNKNIDFWCILGDVKPTLLLKNLISSAKIIIFIYNTKGANPNEKIDTIDFLTQGWGPIVNKIKKSEEQKRVLIGQYSIKLNERILETLEMLVCDAFYTEDKKLESPKNLKSKNCEVISDIINYIKSQTSYGKIQSNPAKNKQSSTNKKRITNEEAKSKIIDKDQKEQTDIYEEDEEEEGQYNEDKREENKGKKKQEFKKLETDNDEENKQKKSDKFKEKSKLSNHQNSKENINDELDTNENEEHQKNSYDDDDNDEKDKKQKTDEYNEEEDNEKEQIIVNRTVDNFVYNLRKNQKAELFQAKDAKGEVNIPNSILFDNIEYDIIKICDSAFQGSQITSLKFQNDSKIIQIGNYAFKNSQIQKIFIPSSLKQLDKYWCAGATNLSEIEVDPYNQHFNSSDGFLIHDVESKPEILFAPRSFRKLEYEIPFNVGSYAFYENYGIQFLFSKNENQILEIGDFSFFGSYYLRKIELISQAINIGDHCFSNSTNLQSIELIGLANITLGQNSFDNCSSLSSIKLQSVLDLIIPANAFNGCKSLKEIDLSTGSELILQNELFSMKNNLKTVELQGKKIQIGEKCFNKSFYEYNYNNKPNTIKIISETDVIIEDNSFEESFIGHAEITGKKIILKQESFNKCSSLSSIFIQSDGHKDLIIPTNAFIGCKSLQIIKFSTNSKLILQKGSFPSNNKLEKVELQAKIIQICEKCFSNSFNRQNVSYKSNYKYNYSYVTNPNTIKIISETDIEIENNSFEGSFIGNVEIEGEKVNLRKESFKKCSSLQKFTISKSTEINIEELTFYGCEYFTTLNLKEIGYAQFQPQTFSNCKQLKSINISKLPTFKSKNYFEKVRISQPDGKYKSFLVSKIRNGEKYSYFNLKPKPNYGKCDEYGLDFIEQIVLLSKENNPTISTQFGICFITDEQKQILTFLKPYYDKGSLEEALNKNSLSNPQKYNILLGIALGLKYLESLNIRDLNLTPHFIFLDESFYPHLNEVVFFKTSKGSIYDSPEILRGRSIDFKSYVYSYSLIMYELITGISINNFINGKRLDLSKINDQYIQIFIEKCLSQNYLARPKFEEIISEITQERYINFFEANEIEIQKYLSLFGKTDIANTVVKNNISYFIFKPSKSAVIQGQNNTIENLDIPDYIEYEHERYYITKINNKSFSKSSIKSILFSENSQIRNIGEYSFEQTIITEITFPKSVELIGQGCFSNSINIKILEFQSQSIKLHESSFENCKSLEAIKFPNSNNITICSKSFIGCDSLNEISIQSSTILFSSGQIKKSQKQQNKNDSKVQSTNDVKNFFSSIENLNKVSIQIDQFGFNNNLFNDMSSLTGIIISTNDNITISQNTFKESISLKTIKLKSLKSVKLLKQSFQNKNLESIYINGENVIIEDNCFYSSKKLQSIKIKSNTLTLNDKCFANCSSLSLIVIQNEGEKDLIIPTSAFNECKSLKEIKIHTRSKLILQNESFSSKNELETVELQGNIIQICEKCFNKSFEEFPDNNPNTIKIISETDVEIENNSFEESFIGIVEITGERVNLRKESFKKCSSLQKFTISKSTEINIEELTFFECESFITFLLNKIGYAQFQPQAISGCDKLHSIKIIKSPVFNPLNCFELKTYPQEGKLNQTFTVMRKENKEKYTATVIKEKDAKDKLENPEEIPIQQIILLSKENNPTISTYFAICYIPYGRKHYLTKLSKCYNDLSLEEALNKEKLSNTQKYNILLGITLGINYLESININNLNLTPQLIFLDESSYPHLNEIIISSKRNIYDSQKNKQEQSSQFQSYVYPYSLIMYELLVGKPITVDENKISKQNHPDLNKINDKEIQEFIKKCWSQNSSMQPKFEEIISEVTKERYINFFEANEIEIQEYLSLFEKTDITSTNMINDISYFIFKPNKSAIIQGVNNDIENLDIPDYIEYEHERYYITKINNKSFSKSSIKSISFSKDSQIRNIGEYSFEQTNITEITFPKSVELIGIGSFENCKTLKKIQFPNSTNITICSKSFNGCDSLQQISFFETSNVELQESCFVNLKNLLSVEINCQTLTFNKNSFENCESLKTFSTQTNESTFISEQFNGCPKLENISITQTQILKLEDDFFSTKNNIKKIKVQSNEDINISSYSFKNCSQLTKVTFKSLKSVNLSDQCFSKSNIKSIEIDSKQINCGNKCFYSAKNIQSFTYKCEELFLGNECFKSCINLQSFTYKCEELFLGNECFKSCINLQSISFENLVNARIGTSTFYECKKLEKISINSSSKLEIGTSCFSDLQNLQSISISSKEIHIFDKCFNNCINLSSISFGKSSIIKLDAYAFYKCEKLRSFSIESSNEIKIGSNCFSYSKNLPFITFTSEEINLSNNCFNNCDNLSSIYFNNAKNIKIGSCLFNKCDKIKDMYISSISRIELCSTCFKDTKNLQKITITCEDIDIGDGCFNNCENLSSVSFFNIKNAKIGSRAFSGCSKLKNFEISATSKLEICENCFSNVTFLNNVKLTGGNLIIENWIFYGCNLINSVIVESKEKHKIGNCAFYGLNNNKIKQIFEGKTQK